jgi:dTMP kinase
LSRFITFEGLDGAGKSTQFNLLAEHLQRLGHAICCTREPGGTAIGDQIRHILHDVTHIAMTSEAEMLLYAASRAQLVRQVIKPRLAQGDIVLCDRYVESSYAYQGYGRQLDMTMLRTLTEFATDGLRPDLIIYLDLDISAGKVRQAQRETMGGEINRMDQQTREFYQRARAGYLAMQQADPTRWLMVDATTSIEAMHRLICQRVETLLPLLNRRG